MQTAQSRTFVHPGVSHKLSDLDRMKYMVQAGKEPWKTSFVNLQANQYASYNYTVRWSTDSIRVVENLGANYEKFKYDALACYYNALQWYITGDARYAEKSVEILNKMKNIRSIVSATQSLCAGRVIPKLLEGAEIIKNTYPGWKQADIEAFKAMLVYPGYSTTVDYSGAAEHSFYWAMYNGDYGRHGNQGIFGMLGTLQIAVFSDNEIMYDRILRYMRGEAHRPDDLPYVSGPTYVNSGKNTASSNSYFDDYSLYSPYVSNQVQDYGYNEVIKNYIWENGQTQEASRDQGHSQLALGLINNICEIAWNQGDDLYSILDHRPLLGWEYYFRYNLSYVNSFPDQTSAWEPTVASGEFIQRRDRSQRWFSKKINPWNANDTTARTRATMFTDNSYTTATGPKTPMYELTLGHYKSRLNLPVDRFKWLNRADSISRKLFGNERQGFQVDYLGFGSLTFHRADSCPGDPVTFIDKIPTYRMNNVPCKIEAEDYDIFTTNGQGRTFYDLTGTKIANDYRPDSAVTLKPVSVGGFKVSDISAGEWLTYSVFFPEYSQYSVSVNYSAVTTGGKIKIQINGIDKTTDIDLPATGEDIFADFILPQTITLLSGVQSVKILVTGISNTIELNAVSISKALVPAVNDYVSKQSGDYNTASNWQKLNAAGTYSSVTTAPATANNTWILAGHSMTASAAVNAKNLVVSGSLVVGTSTTATFNVTLGTAAAPGSLFVMEGGVLRSTTPNAGYVGTISVFGPTIQVDGQLGSANTTSATGSGFRIYCENEKTTISGSGTCNIARLQPGSANTKNQEMVIDMDMNLMNAATNGATLSLLNGDAGLASKTVTIMENRKVTFTGGSAGLLHQQSNSTAQSNTGGDMNYTILGTLDTGPGGLYFTTSTLTSSLNQQININLGPNANLTVGPKFIMIKSQENQGINFNFASGSNVKYAGTSTTTFSSTAPAGITPATFPTSYSNLNIDNPKGISLLSSATIDKSLSLTSGNLTLGSNNLTLLSGSIIAGGSLASHIITNSTGALTRSTSSSTDNLFPVGVSSKRYDPAVINPVSETVFTVTVDSVFNIAPKNIALTNPTVWNINASESIAANLSFTPSTVTSISNPVIARVLNGSWYETDATITGNTFSAQMNSFSVFATGTLNGFGLKSALNDQEWNNTTFFTLNNELTIQGLVAGDKIFVYNSTGQLVSHSISSTGIISMTLPAKGLYLVEMKNHKTKKTLKLIIN